MAKTELQRMTTAQKIAFIQRTARSFRYLKPSVQQDIREFLLKNDKIVRQFAGLISI